MSGEPTIAWPPAAMTVGAVLPAVAGLRLPEAAARFAAAGVAVFPCLPGGKRPLTVHGFHDATADPGRVAWWWGRWPAANIGLPTGLASGVEVVDVDRRVAGSGFDAFARARRAGVAAGWLGVVRTPSGGVHVYYPTDLARPQRSWQAARAHVDFRGEGGYVIVPPSRVDVGGGRRAGYVPIRGPEPRPSRVDGSRLRRFLDPHPAPAAHRAGVARVVDAERLAGWVAALGEGERNRGLFWAVCRLAEAGRAPADALDVLGPAAEQSGLPPREIAVTIRSAYRTTGPTRPRDPAHQRSPAASFPQPVLRRAVSGGGPVLS